MEKVSVYIDGFNFYYGIKRQKQIDTEWNKFYWIDFVKLFANFLGKNQVLSKVVYFTAIPLNKDKSIRQGALLNANKLINNNKFEIIKGKYADRHIICPFCKGDISKPEEKRTDVNIAIKIIEDCISNNTDIISLVSADSDLVPLIEFIEKYFPNKKIRIYYPPSSYSFNIKNNITSKKRKIIELRKNKHYFRNSIMDDNVVVNNKIYTIPNKWK